MARLPHDVEAIRRCAELRRCAEEKLQLALLTLKSAPQITHNLTTSVEMLCDETIALLDVVAHESDGPAQ